jgi:hypothetical protein
MTTLIGSLFQYFDGDMLQPIPPVIDMNLGSVGGTEITTHVKSLMSFGKDKHDCMSTECSSRCKEFICVNAPACDWVLRARRQCDFQWKITKLTNEHSGSCVSEASPNVALVKAMVSAKVIHITNRQKTMSAKELVDHFREIDAHTVGVTLCDSRITDDLGESHPVSKNRKRPAGYYKIYRSLKELRKEQADSFDEGFSHIEQYLAALEEANPGSTFTQEDPQHTTKSFVCLFVMLKGQAECAARSKPLISYDGAFTKVTSRLIVVSCFVICILSRLLFDRLIAGVSTLCCSRAPRTGRGGTASPVYPSCPSRTQTTTSGPCKDRSPTWTCTTSSCKMGSL